MDNQAKAITVLAAVWVLIGILTPPGEATVSYIPWPDSFGNVTNIGFMSIIGTDNLNIKQCDLLGTSNRHLFVQVDNISIQYRYPWAPTYCHSINVSLDKEKIYMLMLYEFNAT